MHIGLACMIGMGVIAQRGYPLSTWLKVWLVACAIFTGSTFSYMHKQRLSNKMKSGFTKLLDGQQLEVANGEYSHLTDLMRVVSDACKEVEGLRGGMEKELTALNWYDPLEIDRLANAQNRSDDLRDLQGVVLVFDRYEGLLLAQLDNYFSHLQSVADRSFGSASEHAMKAAKREIDVTRSLMQQEFDLYRTQVEAISELLVMLDDLEGTFEFEEDCLLFEEDEDLEAFETLVETIEACAQKLDEIMEFQLQREASAMAMLD
ncbi:MAG: hypothetical protein KDK78_06510 [Chlamydiia bacterium]|nr:hypothetical protein [Chlamydiia bacterium]